MDSFHVQATYEIKGRGTVYCVLLPERMRHEDIVARYNGKDVELWIMLDGPRVVRVSGVELWAIPELPKGAPMGLLVTPSTGEERAKD